MKLVKILVTGKVQGVVYRGSAKEVADKLGLSGFARNEPDGSVYIEVEGSGDDVEEFIAWCRVGPRIAKVESVTHATSTPVGHKGFKIL